MIVKIETKAGWVFYDAVDEVMAFNVSPKDEHEPESCQTVWWINKPHNPQSDVLELKLLKLINKGELKHRMLLDNNKAYLMSDVGKTIERIN